jgi:hypothetical protein
MTELFGRTCEVTIDTIQLNGHRVSFNIQKDLKPKPNKCAISVWNLSPDQQAQLEQLRPKAKTDTKGIPCKLEAGYQGDNALLWLGDLRTVDSVLTGSEWVTTAASGDGEKAHQSAKLNLSYGPKTPIETVLRALVRAMGVGEGNVAKVASDLKLKGAGSLLTHGHTMSGSAARQLDDWTRSADLEWSIQDGAIQFIERGKALAAQALVVLLDMGMIGSPTVDQEGLLTVKVLASADVRLGGIIVVDARRIKGNYRVQKATWVGDNFGGEWSVELEAKRY